LRLKNLALVQNPDARSNTWRKYDVYEPGSLGKPGSTGTNDVRCIFALCEWANPNNSVR